MLPVIGVFLIVCGLAVPIVIFRKSNRQMKEKNS
jgi:hypothetical protein